MPWCMVYNKTTCTRHTVISATWITGPVTNYPQVLIVMYARWPEV